MGFRIVLDGDKCQGHGMCVIYAPESFVIDAETNVANVVTAGAARSSPEALELAERMCPVHAIRILADASE